MKLLVGILLKQSQW